MTGSLFSMQISIPQNGPIGKPGLGQLSGRKAKVLPRPESADEIEIHHADSLLLRDFNRVRRCFHEILRWIGWIVLTTGTFSLKDNVGRPPKFRQLRRLFLQSGCGWRSRSG